MEQLLKIGAAINALRIRKGDKFLGSRVEAGKYQLVRTTYQAKGKSTVQELSGWMTADEFIAFVSAQ